MAHLWQGLRTCDWLTSARARGYILILLVISTIAFSGWIAISDGLIAATTRNRLFHEPARQHAAEMAIFGGRECPYVLACDLVLLALAIAFPARHRLRCGYRDFEISLLAAAWLVPLVARYRRRHRHTLRPYRAARAV
jgi:hypothetical protein